MRKFFFLPIFTFFLSTASVAADCLVKDADIATEYSGDCRNGIANGIGKAAGKDQYAGGFLNGLEHGKGTYMWASGSRYEGEWRNGKFDGKGTFTLADGSRYEGEFRNGEKDGKGTFTLADGSRYEGEFRNGEKDGKGTFTLADGSRYEGGWRNGLEHGRGTQILAYGTRYEGEFRNGKKDGKGIQTLDSGIRYEGEFRNSKRNGFGIASIPRTAYIANNASKYGEWKGDFFIMQGLFEDNVHILPCSSKPVCENQNRLDREDRKFSPSGVFVFLENDRKCKIEYPFIPTPKNLTAKSIDSASCKSNGTLDGDVFKGNAFQVEFLSDGIRDSIVFAYGNFGDNRPSASGTSIRPDAYWDFADGERWEDNSSRRYNWHKVRENTNRQSIINRTYAKAIRTDGLRSS